MGLVGVAVVVFFLFQGEGGEEKPSLVSSTGRPTRTDHTVIRLQNMRTEVTSRGVKQHDINAAFGELDEKDKIMDLESLDVIFYKNGIKSGAAQCGSGRVWMKDNEKDKAKRNDVQMASGVDFQSGDGWFLRAPEMRFTNLDSTVRTDAGFVKQKKMKDGGYLVGTGQSFEIVLDTVEGTLQQWTERGNPVVLEKTDKPGIIEQ